MQIHSASFHFSHFVLILFFQLLFITKSDAQYTGKWTGVFHSDMSRIRRTFKMEMQIFEDGKKLWGVYSTTDTVSRKRTDCMCKVAGEQAATKDHVAFIYMEGVLTNNIKWEICNVVFYMSMHLVEKEGYNFISGRWFPAMDTRVRLDGAGGSFVLQKVKDSIDIDITKVFPNLKSKPEVIKMKGVL